VGFIDSTGLGALIALQNAADEAGLKMALLDPLKRVTQVLDIMKLTGVFAVERSYERHDLPSDLEVAEAD
jgi:anti-anti-sigma factor